MMRFINSFIKKFSKKLLKVPTSRLKKEAIYNLHEKKFTAYDTIDLNSIVPKDIFKTCIKTEFSKIGKSYKKEELLENSTDFTSDTGAAIHPRVLQDMVANHYKSMNEVIKKEEESIGKLFNCGADKVYFTASTSQANKLLFSFIRSEAGERFLCSDASHVVTHEIGQPAVVIKPKDQFTGKLTIEDFKSAMDDSNKLTIRAFHLDQPTQYGHFYSKEEIKKIVKFADGCKIPVTMDIERLVGYLARTGESYKEYTSNLGISAVSLGMQKNGGARSSCVILVNASYIKNLGKLKKLTKGRLRNMGSYHNNPITNIGWYEMIKDDLYINNAKIANEHADRIASYLKELKIDYLPVTTNMVFVKFPEGFKKIFDDISDKYSYGIKLPDADRRGYTRIAASHDDSKEEIDSFIKMLRYTYYFDDVNKERINKCSEESINNTISKGDRYLVRKKNDKDAEAKEIIESIKNTKFYNKNRLHCFSEENFFLPKGDIIAFIKASGNHKPYGSDKITKKAKSFLLQKLSLKDKAISFVTSEFQAINCASSLLKDTDGSEVLCTKQDHRKISEECNIKTKILETSNPKLERKIDNLALEKVLSAHNTEGGLHKPYISSVYVKLVNDEDGLTYNKDELFKLIEISNKYKSKVILDIIGVEYSLLENGKSYSDWSDIFNKANVLIAKPSFETPGAAIISQSILNNKNMQMILDRTIKEKGGKQSSHYVLSFGTGYALDNNNWKKQVEEVIKLKKELISIFKKYKIEVKNENNDNNAIWVKLQEKFIKEYDWNHIKQDDDGYFKFTVKLQDGFKDQNNKNSIEVLAENLSHFYSQESIYTSRNSGPSNQNISPANIEILKKEPSKIIKI